MMRNVCSGSRLKLPSASPHQWNNTKFRSGRKYLYLSTGIVDETVTGVSQQLLAHHGGLRRLVRLDVAELARIRGRMLIGMERAAIGPAVRYALTTELHT